MMSLRYITLMSPFFAAALFRHAPRALLAFHAISMRDGAATLIHA